MKRLEVLLYSLTERVGVGPALKGFAVVNDVIRERGLFSPPCRQMEVAAGRLTLGFGVAGPVVPSK